MSSPIEESQFQSYENESETYKEVRKYKFNDFLVQKQRQRLRENSLELRQLERQLKSAVVYKQLSEQLENKAEKKVRDLCTKEEQNAQIAIECELNRRAILQQQEKEKMKKDLLLADLKCQINYLRQKRRLEFDDVRRDYNEMQKLLKQIQAEEIAQRKEYEILRQRCKMEMEEFYFNKKLQQQLENDRNVDESERNLSYQKESDSLKSQFETERKRIQKQKEELSEQLGQKLNIENQEKEKREHLLLSLLVEERKSNDDQRYRESLVKNIKEREKFRIESENYRQDNRIRKERQFKEEEEKFLKENLRFLEERDKIDQLSDEKRRRKKVDHSRALREFIEIRRRQKATEIAAQIAELEKIINDEKKSEQLIKKERIRMLNSVPKELLAYLPPGVLKSCDKEFLTLPGQ